MRAVACVALAMGMVSAFEDSPLLCQRMQSGVIGAQDVGSAQASFLAKGSSELPEAHTKSALEVLGRMQQAMQDRSMIPRNVSIPPQVLARLFCNVNQNGEIYDPGESTVAMMMTGQEPTEKADQKIPQSLLPGQRHPLPAFLSTAELAQWDAYHEKRKAPVDGACDGCAPLEVFIPLADLPASLLAKVRAQALAHNVTAPLYYESAKIREAHGQFIGHADNSYYDTQYKMRLPLAHTMFRSWTLDIMLSDPKEYEGGELIFTHPSPSEHKPNAGDAFLFQSGSSNVHVIKQVPKGTRKVLIVWFHSEPFGDATELGLLNSRVSRRDARATDPTTAAWRSSLLTDSHSSYALHPHLASRAAVMLKQAAASNGQ